MQALSLKFLLLPLLVSGCVTHRLGIETFDNATRFRLVNGSTNTLHGVRLRVCVEQGIVMHLSREKVEDFAPGERRACDVSFPTGILAIEVYGHCKEGRIRGSWWGLETAKEEKQFWNLK